MFHILYEENGRFMSEAVMVKSLVEDLKQIRMSKITNKIKSLSPKQLFVPFNNLSSFEVNIVRPILIKSLEANTLENVVFE